MHLLHSSDDGQPQGSTQPERDRPSDLLERYGKDALRLAEKLADAQADNFKLREKNRTLTTELQDARGKAPADGAVVLSKDDAAQLEAYRALGEPDALKSTLTTAEEAQHQLATLKRERTLADAAAAQGYKAAALAKLPSLAGKDLIVKDVEIDGKPTKAAFVAEDGKEHPLAEYIAQHDAELLPALTAESGTQSNGISFVRQSTGAPAPKQTPAQAHIQRTYNRQGAKDNGTNRR